MTEQKDILTPTKIYLLRKALKPFNTKTRSIEFKRCKHTFLKRISETELLILSFFNLMPLAEDYFERKTIPLFKSVLLCILFIEI